MAEPYVGEIRMLGCSFQINGWAFCNGQLMSIAENQVLFQLIGTTYGGDGQQTFALPDLQGRFPQHQGTSNGTTFNIGQMGGSENVTLTTSQIPAHTHVLQVSNTGTNDNPAGNYIGASTVNAYSTVTTNPNATLNAGSISSAGGGQPHENMMPFTVINFQISLFGIYPSPN